MERKGAERKRTNMSDIPASYHQKDKGQPCNVPSSPSMDPDLGRCLVSAPLWNLTRPGTACVAARTLPKLSSAAIASMSSSSSQSSSGFAPLTHSFFLFNGWPQRLVIIRATSSEVLMTRKSAEVPPFLLMKWLRHKSPPDHFSVNIILVLCPDTTLSLVFWLMHVRIWINGRGFNVSLSIPHLGRLSWLWN